MTATQTQIRRDTNTNLMAATPASAELGYDTTNKRLHIGDGTTLGGTIIPNVFDAQSNIFSYAAAGGTADVITLSLLKAPAAYVAGQVFYFKASASNTGAVTININGLGAKNIYKVSDGTLGALVAGDILNGAVYAIQYDGTQFQMLNAPFASTSAGGWELLAIGTASSSSALDFTSVVTSEFESYALVLNGLRPASSGTNLLIRMSDASRGSFYAGGSDYAWNKTSVSNFTETITATVSDSSINISTSVAQLSSMGVAGVVYINCRPSRRASCVWSVMHSSDSGSTFARDDGAGLFKGSTTAQLDGVRLLFSGGNISEGTAKLYGLKESV